MQDGGTLRRNRGADTSVIAKTGCKRDLFSIGVSLWKTGQDLLNVVYTVRPVCPIWDRSSGRDVGAMKRILAWSTLAILAWAACAAESWQRMSSPSTEEAARLFESPPGYGAILW